jgi:hypothetical protein
VFERHLLISPEFAVFQSFFSAVFLQCGIPESQNDSEDVDRFDINAG